MNFKNSLFSARQQTQSETGPEIDYPTIETGDTVTDEVQRDQSDVMPNLVPSDYVAHRPVRVIMIGPLPPPYGGASVTFQSLIDSLAASGQVQPIVICTDARYTGAPLAKVASFFRCLALFLWKVKDADVVYTHLSNNGRVTIGPVILFISRLIGRRVITRNIGGALDKNYESSSGIMRFLLRYMLGADYVLVQTKALAKFAQNLGLNNTVVWFPNGRPIERYARSEVMTPTLRLVYLGAVSRVKGVDLLLDVVRGLPASDIELTVYGWLHDITEEEIVNAHPRARYGGQLTPEQVRGTLADFDVLVFPSRWYNEGHTGVILEAYAAGLAVVTVDMPAIREIAEDGKTALLFEMGSADALARRLGQLIKDRKLVARLKANAFNKASDFDSKVTDALLINLCREAADRRRSWREA